MKLHKDSHLDHGLTARQLAHVLLTFQGRDAFFKETITLPEDLGLVPCALFGPIMGDDPIPSMLVSMIPRADRKYPSRVVTSFDVDSDGTRWIRLGRPTATRRRVNTLSVIAGPHDGAPCVLYTAFGGPITPREPDDPTLPEHERAASIAFWAEHALVVVE